MGKDGKFTKFLQNKARPLLDELPVPSNFYNDLWYQLLTKHPGLCAKIEELRIDVPSMEEHADLAAEVERLKKRLDKYELIVEELWKHRVQGVPKK